MPSRWDDDDAEEKPKPSAEQKETGEAAPKSPDGQAEVTPGDSSESGKRWLDTPDLPLAAGATQPAADEPATAGVRAEHQVDVSKEAAEAVKINADQTRLEESKDAIKVGILGGKGVGKSYLFQSMVYRIASPTHAGVLSYYMRDLSAQLSMSGIADPNPRILALPDFLEGYSRMLRLPPTLMSDQRWYRLQLNFATGKFGRGSSTMNIEFLDGSGEALELGTAIPQMKELWVRAFRDATVMIFCLPIWTLFPDGDEMTEDDWDYRDRWLKGFARVVSTYREIRNPTLKVRSVLVLTMADDHRSALRTLHRRWIKPCIENPSAEKFLNDVRSGSGITRYLATAREVSSYLQREYRRVGFGGVVTDLAELNYGYGLPWIVPVSAVDGAQLTQIEENIELDPRYRYRGPAPVPAHVELALLAAMCEHFNALM
jgi:hypothetical protein